MEERESSEHWLRTEGKAAQSTDRGRESVVVTTIYQVSILSRVCAAPSSMEGTIKFRTYRNTSDLSVSCIIFRAQPFILHLLLIATSRLWG
jgi:hypothetical protein